MDANKPIGVFDSGIGGLTVVKELLKVLPGERIIYFGDTARVPYGTKSRPTVARFSRDDALFLLEHNVKLIVVACNTASSLAIPYLKKIIKIPIIDVIGPGVEKALAVTKNKKIAVIGTKATISSGQYQKKILFLDRKAKVVSASCPLFVPLVEEGWTDNKVAVDVARQYLRPIRQSRVDTIILGCTHYPLLKNVIRKILGDGVNIIDSAKAVALKTRALLHEKGILNPGGSSGAGHRFYVSDEPDKFKRMGQRFLGRRINFVKKVSVGQ